MKIGGLLITQHPSDLRITDTSKHARIFGGSSGSKSNSFLKIIIIDLLTQKITYEKMLKTLDDFNNNITISVLPYWQATSKTVLLKISLAFTNSRCPLFFPFSSKYFNFLRESIQTKKLREIAKKVPSGIRFFELFLKVTL